MRITKTLIGTAVGATALGATLAFGLSAASASTHSAGKTASTTSSVSAAKTTPTTTSTRHKCP